MPTPSGLLKAGDRLRWKADGTTFRVLKREGNSKADYWIIIEREDGGLIPRPTGEKVRSMRLAEAHYWVFMSGRWEVV